MYNSTSKLHDKNLLLSLFIKPDEFSSTWDSGACVSEGPLACTNCPQMLSS